MQLFLRSLTTGQVVTLEAEAASTIEAVKAKLAAQLHTSQHFRLIHAQRQLSDYTTLYDNDIGHDSTLYVAWALQGGDIEPSLKLLAAKYNCNKMICRKCYARLPLKATNCRKRKCGHSNQLRLKKKPKK